MSMVRTLFAATILTALGVTTAAAAMQSRTAPVGSGRGLFISPMGEPFRSPSRKDSLRAWFDGADTGRDGGLSLAEMRRDGERFYALLNTNKDRELDPDELRNYETRIVPEIRVGTSRFGMISSGGSNAANGKRDLARERRGAGVYGLLPTPNPVASADTNFNRGISPEEFARAARDRFTMLDANRDGQIRFDELPPLPSLTVRF